MRGGLHSSAAAGDPGDRLVGEKGKRAKQYTQVICFAPLMRMLVCRTGVIDGAQTALVCLPMRQQKKTALHLHLARRPRRLRRLRLPMFHFFC